jgi:hypothetical protein
VVPRDAPSSPRSVTVSRVGKKTPSYSEADWWELLETKSVITFGLPPDTAFISMRGSETRPDLPPLKAVFANFGTNGDFKSCPARRTSSRLPVYPTSTRLAQDLVLARTSPSACLRWPTSMARPSTMMFSGRAPKASTLCPLRLPPPMPSSPLGLHQCGAARGCGPTPISALRA